MGLACWFVAIQRTGRRRLGGASNYPEFPALIGESDSLSQLSIYQDRFAYRLCGTSRHGAERNDSMSGGMGPNRISATFSP
jgi:hypothetical protein